VAANRDRRFGVDRSRSLRDRLVVYPSPNQYRSHSSATATASEPAGYRELTRSLDQVHNTLSVTPACRMDVPTRYDMSDLVALSRPQRRSPPARAKVTQPN
jgi:hypothetical protein